MTIALTFRVNSYYFIQYATYGYSTHYGDIFITASVLK